MIALARGRNQSSKPRESSIRN